MKNASLYWVAFLLIGLVARAVAQAPDSLVFGEVNGLVAVEAEHYYEQTHSDVRKWYLYTTTQVPGIQPDPDGNHAASASGGAYMEILPDTRVTHSDPLISGVNFSNSPAPMAVISYLVNFTTTGLYYVWVRCYSTGSEDNGVHAGINDTWPATGQRMQWCDGKNSWKWESKQRTAANHCGEPYKIYLNVPEPGIHKISFSMREDGFEMDKWLMTTDRFYTPSGFGPDEVILSGADTTAPTAPVGLDAELEGENRIRLTWGAAEDPESGISGYRIYRNGTAIRTVGGNIREFSDASLAYATEFTYEVSAINPWGKESEKSHPVQIATLPDGTPPTMTEVQRATIGGTLRLYFSEPVAEAGATNVSSYSISGGVEVQAASLSSSGMFVTLTTTPHAPGVDYTLTVDGIEDVNGNPVPADQNTITYLYLDAYWSGVYEAVLEGGAQLKSKDGALSGQAGICLGADSRIIFTLDLPKTGFYSLWARLFYEGSGDDPKAFLISVDDKTPKILGNNKSYFNRWHWDGDGNVQSGVVKALYLGMLSEGAHTFAVTPHEPAEGSDKVFIDGIIVSTVSSFKPTDKDVAYHTAVEEDISAHRPEIFGLALSAYPNPFNNQTQIEVKHFADHYDLEIYNMMGRRELSIEKGNQRFVRWNSTGLPSGAYLIQVRSKNAVASMKVMLLK